MSFGPSASCAMRSASPTGVRWLLSLYIILCTGYVTMNAARGWHWPTFGTKWLPWLQGSRRTGVE